MSVSVTRDKRVAQRPRNDRTSRFGEHPALLDPEQVALRNPPPAEPEPVPPREPAPPPVPFAHLPAAFRRVPLDPAAVADIDVMTENLATWYWAPVEWEWGLKGPLPDGSTLQVIPDFGLVVIVANGGTGKGMVCAAYLGSGTTTRPFPLMPEWATHEPGDYIVIAPEDDRSSALIPRLLAAGVDTSRIHDLTTYRGMPVKLPSGLPLLQATIAHLTSKKMRARGVNLRGVIIDPITAAADEPLTSDARAERTLRPLAALGMAYRFPVIVTHHTNWDGGIQGVTKIRNIPRIVWYMEPHETDPKAVVMSLTGSKGKGKANITSRDQALVFTIEEEVPGEPVTARAVFLDKDYAQQRLNGPAWDHARAWWQDNAWVVTDVQPEHTADGRVSLTGPPEAVGPAAGMLAIEAPAGASPADRGAMQLAAAVGGDWDDPGQRENFRQMAAAALKAAR
jgi:AAA domain-containing protein